MLLYKIEDTCHSQLFLTPKTTSQLTSQLEQSSRATTSRRYVRTYSTKITSTFVSVTVQYFWNYFTTTGLCGNPKEWAHPETLSGRQARKKEFFSLIKYFFTCLPACPTVPRNLGRQAATSSFCLTSVARIKKGLWYFSAFLLDRVGRGSGRANL